MRNRWYHKTSIRNVTLRTHINTDGSFFLALTEKSSNVNGFGYKNSNSISVISFLVQLLKPCGLKNKQTLSRIHFESAETFNLLVA